MDTDEKASNDPMVPSKEADFEQLWLRVATDIIIRKFKDLNDIPEFCDLPDSLKEKIKSALLTLGDKYEIIRDEQALKTYYAILYPKDKENYLAIFEEQTRSQQMKEIATKLGFSAAYHGCLNFYSSRSTQAQTSNSDKQEPSQSVEENNSNHAGSRNWHNFLPNMASIDLSQYIPSIFPKPSSTAEISCEKLIEKCMLRKLEGIANTK